MDTLLLTLSITFVIVVIAVGLLAIGWLTTGRSKIQPGACGRDPNKKREESCSTTVSCQLCEKHDDKPNDKVK